MAGDPAQNVTKGVEFRFNDIRSVGYYVAGGDRRLIPEKPQTVNVNFRSHSGVLEAAAFVLSKMFNFFPNAVKELERDYGLFGGPRPAVLNKVSKDTMASLLHNELQGTIVLTHDENVAKCIEELQGYELVYGIRKAKGLEFKKVMIFNFFCSLPDDLQRPWRELLLERADVHDFKNKFPQVELQLKLLYTAVTRCIDRLYFAETDKSISGDAFVKVATIVRNNGERPIATTQKNMTIDNMVLPQDEWASTGITNAEAAEAEMATNSSHAVSLMEKAIYCFKHANNDLLLNKAKIQLDSFKLRSKIFNSDHIVSNSISDFQKEAIPIFVKLLEENLVLEAKDLGRDLQTILDDQLTSFLDKQVLQNLK